METLSSTYEIAAPVDVVWSVMTDHQRYGAWTSARRVILETAGSPHRDGVGAVRVFDMGRLAQVREEVTEFEPPLRMRYKMLNRFPARDYEALMELTPSASGSSLQWSGRLTPTVPLTGALVRRVFVRAVDEFAAGIREAAEQLAAPPRERRRARGSAE